MTLFLHLFYARDYSKFNLQNNPEGEKKPMRKKKVAQKSVETF